YQTPAPRTGPSVIVVPSGSPGTTTIPVSATYSCSGISGTTASASATITTGSQVATPYFAQASVALGVVPTLICTDEVVTATVTATVAGAGTSIYWTGSSGVSVSPNPSASGQQVSITATHNGLLTVTAQAGNPRLGCQSSNPISFSFVRERAPLDYNTNPVLLSVNGQLANAGSVIVNRPATLEAYQLYDYY
ncbi:hypothetical protein ACFSX6_16405, partial [Hymenobacter rubripertinctus]